MIYNNIDFLIILIKYIRFNKILKYKIARYFQINLKNAF